jgi:hypothetical protein
MGEAMRKQAAEKQKTQSRRDAAKADKAASAALKVGKGKAIMVMTEEQAGRLAELEAKGTARNFKENQERLKLMKLAPVAEPEQAADDVEAPAEEAPSAPAEKPAAAAPAPAAKPKAPKAEAPAAASDEAGIYLGTTRVPLDKSSPLHKSILKICKAFEALEAAKAGE